MRYILALWAVVAVVLFATGCNSLQRKVAPTVAGALQAEADLEDVLVIVDRNVQDNFATTEQVKAWRAARDKFRAAVRVFHTALISVVDILQLKGPTP